MSLLRNFFKSVELFCKSNHFVSLVFCEYVESFCEFSYYMSLVIL